MTAINHIRITIFRARYYLRAMDMTDQQVLEYLHNERAIRRQINRLIENRRVSA